MYVRVCQISMQGVHNCVLLASVLKDCQLSSGKKGDMKQMILLPMPGSLHILVTLIMFFCHFSCLIFWTMFSVCKQDLQDMQDRQDKMKNKQTIT